MIQNEAERTLERGRVAERERGSGSGGGGVSFLFVREGKPDLGADVTDQELVDDEARGMTHAELAEAHGLALAMVAPRLRRARRRGVKPSTQKHETREEEEMVRGVEEQHEEVEEVEQAVEVEEDDGGWMTARELGELHGLSHTGVGYRYKAGKPLAGRTIERRDAEGGNGRASYRYRLGAPAEVPDYDAALRDLEAARERIAELETQLKEAPQVASDDIERKLDEERARAQTSHFEVRAARKRAEHLEERLAADARAAAARIAAVEAEAEEFARCEHEKVVAMGKTLAERDARIAELEAKNEELRDALDAVPTAVLEQTSGPDLYALHRILGGLDVMIWRAEAEGREVDARHLGQLAEMLAAQVGARE